MSEEPKKDEAEKVQPEHTDNEEVKRIRLRRHLWPEEVEIRKRDRKIRRLRIGLAAALVIGVLAGWAGGSVFPNGTLQNLKNNLSTLLGSDKIQAVKNLMENDWYFHKDIDNLDERLTDQAITGMTTNQEDRHTEYMSAEEMKDFTQSINRDYVGIGVSFTSYDNVFMVDEVFADSPAEKAGVQSGDIFEKVDGKDITSLTTDELKNLVQGEEGTDVNITFRRGEEDVTLKITRAAVSATAYGRQVEDGIYYLQMQQFGNGTPDEVKNYLSDTKGSTKLILDLRNNGGGYLDSVSHIASLFLPEDKVVLQREYANGETTETRTSGGQITNIHGIVILVNENTASAAEVLTICLKEQRDDVTIVGTTTYGKGTVQISRQFTDGSAIKYTTSKWLSPNGVWVNDKGITPDIEVNLDEALTRSFTGMADEETWQADQTAAAIGDMEVILKYLGYDPGRTDGYFSNEAAAALKKYEEDHQLTADGILSSSDYKSLLSSLSRDWHSNKAHDAQYQKALEVLHA
jgi:carboxyl-terminal processing protease